MENLTKNEFMYAKKKLNFDITNLNLPKLNLKLYKYGKRVNDNIMNPSEIIIRLYNAEELNSPYRILLESIYNIKPGNKVISEPYEGSFKYYENLYKSDIRQFRINNKDKYLYIHRTYLMYMPDKVLEDRIPMPPEIKIEYVKEPFNSPYRKYLDGTYYINQEITQNEYEQDDYIYNEDEDEDEYYNEDEDEYYNDSNIRHVDSNLVQTYNFLQIFIMDIYPGGLRALDTVKEIVNRYKPLLLDNPKCDSGQYYNLSYEFNGKPIITLISELNRELRNEYIDDDEYEENKIKETDKMIGIYMIEIEKMYCFLLSQELEYFKSKLNTYEQPNEFDKYTMPPPPTPTLKNEFLSFGLLPGTYFLRQNIDFLPLSSEKDIHSIFILIPVPELYKDRHINIIVPIDLFDYDSPI